MGLGMVLSGHPHAHRACIARMCKGAAASSPPMRSVVVPDTALHTGPAVLPAPSPFLKEIVTPLQGTCALAHARCGGV